MISANRNQVSKTLAVHTKWKGGGEGAAPREMFSNEIAMAALENMSKL